MDKLSQFFLQTLIANGVSKVSLKNYSSDLKHFTGWLLLKLRSLGTGVESLSETVPFLNPKIAQEYKSFLCENKVSAKTINRRLSTLRHLSRFLLVSQILDHNFMEGLSNITGDSYETDSFLNEFERYLRQEKVSSNTIKSYLSDIKQFISWVDTN